LGQRGIGPHAVTVGSKWGYTYVGDWRLDAPVHEIKDHSLSALTRQIAESRALLGDFLELYQVHSATIESGILEDRAVLAALNELRTGGLVIGLSVSGPRQAEVIQRALTLQVDGHNPFQCVQATWNILEPSAAVSLAEAHAAGWGVIIKEVLANGRLASRDQLAIAAALAQPWVDVVLSGAVTPEQVLSNVGAVDRELSAEEVTELAKPAESPDAYWRARSQLPWT
jgi:aryl-alcohol dehydrogenase-like predicted oxidoreductase